MKINVISYGISYNKFKYNYPSFKDETPNITIIGTTNISPENKGLDGAVMSRFKNIIEVPFPDKEGLYEAFKARIAELEHGQDFIKNNDAALRNMAEKMVKRKCSYRDLEKIYEASTNYYLLDFAKDKNTKYKFDYIEKAEKSLHLTDGEMAGAT